jgi:hypothetical protein
VAALPGLMTLERVNSDQRLSDQAIRRASKVGSCFSAKSRA